MKRWSIGRKLGACLGGMLAMLLILGFISERTISGLGEEQELTVNGLAKKVDLAGTMNSSAGRMNSSLRGMILAAYSKDTTQLEQSQRDFRTAAAAFEK